jgi:hypothetical protein
MPDNQIIQREVSSILDGLDLDSSERQILERALGVTSSDESAEKALLARLNLLQASAFKELVDWIIGRRRFSSISESDMHRVVELFLNVRGEAPSVDQLVTDLAIPAARSTSLLARMRYGEGRALTALAMRTSASKLRKKLDSTTADGGGRKSVWVDGDILADIRRAAMAIMDAPPESHNKGGDFQGAQFPDITSYGKDGGVAKTTLTMWEYILTKLDPQAEGPAR